MIADNTGLIYKAINKPADIDLRYFKLKLFIMLVLEFIIAILQFILNLALAVCMIPFVPIVWVIREIKGVKPVIKEPYVNLPKIQLKPRKEEDER